MLYDWGQLYDCTPSIIVRIYQAILTETRLASDDYQYTLRLMVVSREAKEEAATARLMTYVHECFTGTDTMKIENAIIREPQALSIYNSRQ